jgi:16S rRNA U1498 N3-methylase RsmE
VNLVLLAPEELGADGSVTLHGRRAAHLLGVLGVEVGSRLRVGVARGATGWGEVVACGGGAVTLTVALADAAPAPPTVGLVVALPRPKALTRLLGAVASIGVERIDRVNAWRVDKSYFGSPRLAPAALAEAVWLGCEQGVTPWVPEVRVFRRFADLLAELPLRAARCRLLAHPRAERPLEAVVQGHDAPTILALGPRRRLDRRRDRGARRPRLRAREPRPRVLRSEIAAPVALAALALAGGWLARRIRAGGGWRAPLALTGGGGINVLRLMTVEIREIPLGGGLRDFLDVVDYIYRDDPAYVRPLDFDVGGTLSPKNPFFLHGEGTIFTRRTEMAGASAVARRRSIG